MAKATAPTEAEIRRSIVDLFGEQYPNCLEGDIADSLSQIIRHVATPLVWPVDYLVKAEEHGPSPDESPWGVLSPAEARDLDAIAAAAMDRALQRAIAIVVEELVGAGVAFAEAHPNAPRSKDAPALIDTPLLSGYYRPLPEIPALA